MNVSSTGMKVTVALILTLFFSLTVMAQKYKCLPPDISEDSVVSVSAAGTGTAKPVTVKQTLAKMKAKCRNGKLVDCKGKEIRFYNLQGCWGNPPADYQEILEKQRKEIADLKKKYTVIEMTCDTAGAPQRSIS